MMMSVRTDANSPWKDVDYDLSAYPFDCPDFLGLHLFKEGLFEPFSNEFLQMFACWGCFMSCGVIVAGEDYIVVGADKRQTFIDEVGQRTGEYNDNTSKIFDIGNNLLAIALGRNSFNTPNGICTIAEMIKSSTNKSAEDFYIEASNKIADYLDGDFASTTDLYVMEIEDGVPKLKGGVISKFRKAYPPMNKINVGEVKMFGVSWLRYFKNTFLDVNDLDINKGKDGRYTISDTTPRPIFASHGNIDDDIKMVDDILTGVAYFDRHISSTISSEHDIFILTKDGASQIK